MEFAVKTEALTKRFGKHVAVDAVGLAVPLGSIFGFLGSNGAGKSTSVRMILGLSRPTSGRIDLFGEPLQHRHRPMIGAMADSPGGAFYDHLSARDNLRVFATTLGAADDLDALLDRVGLSAHSAKKVAAFSTGMRQRLGIARALVGNPPLIIMDEPLNGLDPEGIREMRGLVRTLAEGRTIIICSHLLGEVEKVATHIGLLADGRLIHQGAMSDLASGPPQLDLVAEGDAVGAICQRFASDVTSVGANRLRLTLQRGDVAPALNAALVEAGVRVRELTPYRFSLEDFYHDRIGSARHD